MQPGLLIYLPTNFRITSLGTCTCCKVINKKHMNLHKILIQHLSLALVLLFQCVRLLCLIRCLSLPLLDELLRVVLIHLTDSSKCNQGNG